MTKRDKITVVYDDKCPFCQTYCKLVRIREAAGDLELIDARQPSKIMDEITVRGLDIDQGMVVKIGEDIYYGADAIHVLALMSTKSGIFNRLSHWVFRSKKLSAVLYPFLRTCRNIALRIMGISFIRNLER